MPDRVGEPLPERAGGGLDAGRQAVLGVARVCAAPLPERLEVVERQVVAGQVEERVQQHAGVAGGQHEPVAVGPVGVRGGVAQEPRPHHIRHRRGAHRGAGVPGVRLLDGVDRERPDGVDGELVEVGGDSHIGQAPIGRGVAGPLSRGGLASVIVATPPLSSGDAADPSTRPPASSQAPGATVTSGAAGATTPEGRTAGIGEDRGPRRPDARRRDRPGSDLESGTDVPGRVSLVQGGSAATTARWLGRLGARSSLIASVGRDAAGRALVDAIRSDGVTARVMRVAGARTGRIGVLVSPDGERSFVADRGAADQLRPDDLQASWFKGADALHLPVYSLLGEPLGDAGRRGIELARAAGAVVSMDLASIGPLLVDGRRSARALIADVGPDLLFATASEAAALLGGRAVDGLLEFAATAVVKRGPRARPCWHASARAAPGSRWRPSMSPPPTRPVRATPSTPGSSSAGSRRVRPDGRFPRHSSARRWPGTGRPRGSCRRHGRSCRWGEGAGRGAPCLCADGPNPAVALWRLWPGWPLSFLARRMTPSLKDWASAAITASVSRALCAAERDAASNRSRVGR